MVGSRSRHAWTRTDERDERQAAEARLRLAGGLLVSLVATTVLAASALSDESRLGVPAYWAWVLTALQVFALWAAGGRRWWGWLLGAAVQPPWIAYAVLTGQIGFIPGCAVSAVVQAYSFLRASAMTHPRSTRDPLHEVAA